MANQRKVKEVAPPDSLIDGHGGEVRRPVSPLCLVAPTDLCARLLAAVEKAAVLSAASMDDLRATVEEFTTVLKQQGASPEAVLIALKAQIRHQTFPSEVYRMEHIYGDPVRQNISTWSIKEFFRQESSS